MIVVLFILHSHRKTNREVNSDDNNNTMKKMKPIRPSNSSGNLVDNRFYMSDDQDLTRERKGLVKRTKSFWKFGKNSSDSEILEGMALWRHRDLVDVDEQNMLKRNVSRRFENSAARRPSRDKSNDSDRTINAKQMEENERELIENTKVSPEVQRHRMSTNEKPKLSLPRRRESDLKDDDDFENHFEKHNQQHSDDQFYDDGDDGLIMKTVNRKNILQQYSNDSTGPDTESESELISDDPYDCIVVDDQKVKKNSEHFPNVAAIGKKLEKLSKNSKYPPSKGNNVNNNKIYNSIDKNDVNLKNERNNIERVKHFDNENGNIIHYREQRHSFKTFGIEIQNNENGENEIGENDRFYSPNHGKRNNDTNSQDRRRYRTENSEHSNLVSDRRGRSSYETIDSHIEHHDNRHPTNNRRLNADAEKMKYYPERNKRDDLSDEIENKQFLPRTKLTKTNSGNSKKSTYDDEANMMEYDETLQKRIRSPDRGAKFNEKNPNSGNMYGPWYDLWGLDASVRK